MSQLANKTVIITGASRGIGAASARHLAHAGANVVLAARSKNDIELIAREITDAGGQALAATCDVADYDQVAALMATSAEAFGTVDIVVNNAGLIEPVARIADSDPQDWVRVADVNYKGVYFTMRAALPIMLAAGGGTIINISSGAATSPLEGWSHYCSSKAAALMLTRCADKEYRAQGIRVIGLSPGTVATDMQVAIKASGINPVSQLEMSDHIPPQWVAQAIAFLCGPDGAEYQGTDFVLRAKDSRLKLGLPLDE